MTPSTYAEVFEAAKQWPPVEQVGLAEALLRNVRSAWQQSGPPSSEDSSLRPLSGMSTTELLVLANAVVSPAQQERLGELLDKSKAGMLSQEEAKTLDELLDAADQVALLKARAMYSLKLSN